MNIRSVSIVVPCRNEAAHIRRFLASLMSQDLDGLDCELLVADGMSVDGTREAIEEMSLRHPSIRLIDNPGRIASTGLNAAILASRGDVIVRMDAHTEYAQDYVKRCLETLEKTGADNVGGPARTRAEGFMQQAVATAYHSRFACGGARFHDPAWEGPVDTVTYGCWRRSVFEKFGLFDEELVRNQDDEHNFRITRNGGRIWQNPEIVSWYRPRTSLSALFRQYFQYGYWKIAVIRKHRLPASVRHLIPGLFVLTLASLLVALAVTAIAGSPASVRAVAAVLGGVVGLYLLAAGAASLTCDKPYGRHVTAALPLIFAAYHTAYGSGFLLGLLHAALAPSRRTPARIATELTR